MKIETTLAQMRDDPDWKEAFGFAETRQNIMARGEADKAPFRLSDVVAILASYDGENDGESWRALGRLEDGRCFFLSGGCGYSGWDCCGSATIYVAFTLPILFRELGDEDRYCLGIPA